MPVATITAEFVNQPKEGKRYGSVKDKALGYVSVKPEDLSKFTKGSRYQIEYTETAEGYKNFVRIVAPANGAAPNGSSGADSRMIFITGTVGRAMQSGKFTVADLVALAESAARAYDKINAPKSPAPEGDEAPEYGGYRN